MDANLYATLALSGLAGLGMTLGAGLTGWRGWLRLRSQELAARHGEALAEGTGTAGRIEIADLRERVRKLEAIAAGVEL